MKTTGRHQRHRTSGFFMQKLRLKLIACNVFQREACLCLVDTPHAVDVEFLELGEHVRSSGLREKLQARLDAAEAMPVPYDAILLLYGLCGNATVGLKAGKAPLVLPRAHDCATVLLGSKESFQTHFQDNPSRPFGSVGYMERGEYFLRTGDGAPALVVGGDVYASYVEEFGEENAKFIWESMHPQQADNTAIFINIPETANLGHAEIFREKAEAEGKTFLRLEGNLSLIRRLIHGHWDPADFLTVPPGETIAGVYDWREIIRAAPAP
jgi:hypothetical protein